MKIEQVTPKLSSFMAVFPCFGKGLYIQFERMQNLIACKLIPILLLTLLCSACDYVAYSNDVNAESIKKIQKKKNFIYNIGFEGITSKVNYCEKCEINKYSITIQIKKLSSKITFSDLDYPPCYYFRDSSLVLAVNKKIFNLVKKGEQIQKLPKSKDIIFSEERIQLLSGKNSEWLSKSEH